MTTSHSTSSMLLLLTMVMQVCAKGVITDASGDVIGIAPICVYADVADLQQTGLGLDPTDNILDRTFIDLPSFSDVDRDALCAGNKVPSSETLMQDLLLDYESLIEFCDVGGTRPGKQDFAFNAARTNASILIAFSQDQGILEYPSVSYLSYPRGPKDFDYLICNTIKTDPEADNVEDVFLSKFLLADDATVEGYIAPSDISIKIDVEVNPWIGIFTSWWYIMIFQGIMPTMFLIAAITCAIVFSLHIRQQYSQQRKQRKPYLDLMDIVTRIGAPMEFFVSLAFAIRLYGYGWFNVENTDVVSKYTWQLFASVFTGTGLAQTMLVAIYWHNLSNTIDKPTRVLKPVKWTVIVAIVISTIVCVAFDVTLYMSVLFGLANFDIILNVLLFVLQTGITIYFYRNFYMVRKRVAGSRSKAVKERLNYIASLLLASGIIITVAGVAFGVFGVTGAIWSYNGFVPLWIMYFMQRAIGGTILQVIAMAPPVNTNIWTIIKEGTSSRYKKAFRTMPSTDASEVRMDSFGASDSSKFQTGKATGYAGVSGTTDSQL